ncbi:unnamed protein product [Diamesa tonsa]
MDKLQKKEVLQAVVIAENFNQSFSPLTTFNSPALLPVVNVPLISYVLEALNRNGVEEVFIFCSTFVEKMKSFISDGITNKLTWSVGMDVKIISSEGCRCYGDAIRDLDAKGYIRSNFILMNSDTITNCNLKDIVKIHKDNCTTDKGTVMTVVYKKVSPDQRTGNEIMAATVKDTNRLLHHQRLNPLHKERKFEFPIEIFLTNNEVVLHHDLMDPQIVICSMDVLPLFADNFDFETRDHFIKGILMNEEILGSTIYVAELPSEQYAAKVSNWNTYHMISKDIINRWAYPLVPDMGVCCLTQQYLFLRNNIYRHKNVTIERNCSLVTDLVIHEGCTIGEKSALSNTVMGRNCKVGRNCVMKNCYLLDNCVVEDNCKLENCVIGNNALIKINSVIVNGAVVGDDCVIPAKSRIEGHLIQSIPPVDEFGDADYEKLGDKAFKLIEVVENIENSDDEGDDLPGENASHIVRLGSPEPNYASSVYSSSDSENESEIAESIPEDSNIFMSEVLDSLKRGFEEKSNPDFLILEINSSRYAYNMALNEVNFYVVKAVLNLPVVKESTDIIGGIKQIYKYLGSTVLKNYIKGDGAMGDCLNAIIECCDESLPLKQKLPNVVKFLYDEDVITEDVILSWYSDLDEDKEWVKTSLKKIVEWLEQASEEEDSD